MHCIYLCFPHLKVRLLSPKTPSPKGKIAPMGAICFLHWNAPARETKRKGVKGKLLGDLKPGPPGYAGSTVVMLPLSKPLPEAKAGVGGIHWLLPSSFPLPSHQCLPLAKPNQKPAKSGKRTLQRSSPCVWQRTAQQQISRDGSERE